MSKDEVWIPATRFRWHKHLGHKLRRNDNPVIKMTGLNEIECPPSQAAGLNKTGAFANQVGASNNNIKNQNAKSKNDEIAAACFAGLAMTTFEIDPCASPRSR